MRGFASRDQLLNWASAFAGFLVAFFLIAPLFATLAWKEELGAMPGLALIGVAVLLMVGSIIASPGSPPRNLNRLRNTLVGLGVVLTVVGVFIWR
jgi:hypothetical protein